MPVRAPLTPVAPLRPPQSRRTRVHVCSGLTVVCAVALITRAKENARPTRSRAGCRLPALALSAPCNMCTRTHPSANPPPSAKNTHPTPFSPRIGSHEGPIPSPTNVAVFDCLSAPAFSARISSSTLSRLNLGPLLRWSRRFEHEPTTDYGRPRPPKSTNSCRPLLGR